MASVPARTAGADLAARRCRIERHLVRHQRPQLCEHRAHLRRQFGRPGRGAHATVRAQEQRIGEQVAQPLQRLARRRLGHADPACGAGEVALGLKRLEQGEKGHVDAG